MSAWARYVLMNVVVIAFVITGDVLNVNEIISKDSGRGTATAKIREITEICSSW